MSKNVQIPYEFLGKTYALILRLEAIYGDELDHEIKTLCKQLETQIGAKIEAIDRRRTFTEYKTAQQGSQQREEKRNEYLEKAGIHRDWRSEKETSLLPTD